MYWKIKISNYEVYRTSVNKNSFTTPAGSVNFKILDYDKIFVYVYDRDFSSPDDFISKFELKNNVGNFNVKNKTFYANKISKTNYSFIKSTKKIESKNKGLFKKTFKKIDISYKINSITEVKKNKMMGVLINLSTKTPNYFEDKDTIKYFLTTIDIKNKLGSKTYNYYHIVKLAGNDTISKTYFKYFNLNSKNSLKLFLPYSNIDTNNKEIKIHFKTYIIDDKTLEKKYVGILAIGKALKNLHYSGKKTLVAKNTKTINLK